MVTFKLSRNPFCFSVSLNLPTGLSQTGSRKLKLKTSDTEKTDSIKKKVTDKLSLRSKGHEGKKKMLKYLYGALL